MPEFHVFLKGKREIAHNTMEFTFSKPDGFDYQPGQFMNWIYLNQPVMDKKGNRRSMSFASSPTEPDLVIAMRMSDSAYKQSLLKAPVGTEFLAIGPAGKFVLPQDTAKELVFLAGGIGITPFRSMVKYITDRQLPYHITLFYSNFCLEGCAYYTDLEAWEKKNTFFRFVPTLTGGERVEATWTGERTLIDEALLRRQIPDIMRPTYMIVGPPAMVDAMVALLKNLQLPKEQVIVEKFTGL